jgi:DNA polymerase III delta prime subunit
MREKITIPYFSPSLLIVGADEEGRVAKAEEVVGQPLSEAAKNPDFFLLSPQESIGIEEVKSLQRFLVLKPFGAGRKTVLIKEAQNLTREAQNALLKTLEEPPVSSLIILTAPDAALLLATIISRCNLIELALKPQVSLSTEQIREIEALLAELLPAGIGERFVLLENLGLYKDRGESLAWLNKLTVVARQQLINAYQNRASKPALLSLLKAINRAKKYLQANCNVRLVMEVFLSEI